MHMESERKKNGAGNKRFGCEFMLTSIHIHNAIGSAIIALRGTNLSFPITGIRKAKHSTPTKRFSKNNEIPNRREEKIHKHTEKDEENPEELLECWRFGVTQTLIHSLIYAHI